MKNGKPRTINEKRTEILALSAFIMDMDYLDELITEYQGDPEQAAFVKHCRFLRKVKHHIEVTEANLGLHEQFEAAQKEYPGKDNSPKQKQGEFIDNPEAA